MIQHQHIELNTLGKDYVVGDIHGEFDLLYRSLIRYGFDETKDRLFAVGDLIDRGPHSAKCLKLLHEPWFFSVLGNHEDMFLKGRYDPLAKQLHLKNGGRWINSISEETYNSFETLIQDKMPLAMTIETHLGQVGIIHAEAPAHWLDLHHDQKDWDRFLWSVQQFNQALTKTSKEVIGIDVVVHGHVNCDYIEYGKNQVWIDTILRSGKLTVVSIDQLFGR